MKGIAATFRIENEEWYTYNRSPRPNVHVLASVDESSYTPDTPKKMGDHPVVWSNEHMKARNIYIFMGHQPSHFANRRLRRCSTIRSCGRRGGTDAVTDSAGADDLRGVVRGHGAAVPGAGLLRHAGRGGPRGVRRAGGAVLREAARRDHFEFEATTRWEDLTAERLKGVDVVLFLNESPHAAAQRSAFEAFMEKGRRVDRLSRRRLQRREHEVAVVCELPRRGGVSQQQLAAAAGDAGRG